MLQTRHPAAAQDPRAAGLGAHTATARLTGNLAWSLGSDLAARGASLWLAIFGARLLSVPHFGLFALTQSTAQFLWVLGDSVANNAYATREVARDRAADHALPSLLYTMRMGAGLLLSALYLLCLFLLPIGAEKRAALAAAAVFFVCYAMFPDWLARGFENFRGLAVANLTMSLLIVIASVTLLREHPNPGLASALWGGSFAVGAVVLLAVLAFQNRFRYRLRLSVAASRLHLRRSWIFALGGIGSLGITHLPVILLGAMTSARELALFSANFRLVIAGIGLGAVIWWPAYPLLSAVPIESESFRSGLRLFVGTMLGVSLPLALGLSWFADGLLPIVFGSAYAGAAPLMHGLAWTLPLYFAMAALETTTLAIGGERSRARINAIALAVLVATTSALIPRLGASGAVVGLVAALSVAVVSYMVLLLAALPRDAWPVDVVRAVFVSFLTLALFWLAMRALGLTPPWVDAALGIVLYGAMLVRLRVVQPRVLASLWATHPRSARSAPGS